MSTGTNQSSFSELITLAQFGDQEAITELYDRTYSAVYHTTKALIRDEDTAQDVLQDAYIKGFQNLDKLRQPEQFPAWMKMIATNTAKNVLKRKKPILFSEMENEDGEMEVEFVDDRVEHLPEIAMDRKETSRLVSEILDTLPDDQRLVMGMFYYEEMSVQQIARTLGISENTVKSRLNYGRKKVEVKVRDLEKRGTKLYSLAPLPFLLWLLRMQASAEVVPSAAVLDAITAECAGAAFGEAAAFTAATETAETASTTSQGGRFAAQGTKGAAKAVNKAAVGAKAAAKTAVKTAAKGGAKALGAKIIAGVLAAGIAGSGIYYGADKLLNKSEQPVETAFAPAISAPKDIEAAAAQEAPAEAMPVSENDAAHAAYQQVLNNYAQVLGVDSEVYGNECFDYPEKYFNGDHVAIRYYHMFHSHDFYSAYYDIDHDGTDELLIGISSDGSRFSIVDVYGFDGGAAVELVDEIALGERASLTLHQDGSIFSSASVGGMFPRVEEWYNIVGTSLVPSTPSNAPEVTDIPWQKLEPNQPEISAENKTNSSENTDWAAAYEAALGDYRGVWAITWDNPALIGRERELYPNARGSDTTLNHTTEKMLYATKDLNGDGTPELLIGVDYRGNGEISLYDAFAANGETPVHLVPEGSSFTILNDGAIVEADSWFGTIEQVKRIAQDGYSTDSLSGDALQGKNLFEDSTDFSAHGGKLTGLDWHPLEDPLTRQTANAVSFDALRADIRAACMVTDYDSRPDYYNNLYSHLGRGATWALCNREVPKEAGIGALYYNVFCVEFDIDNDGEKELCVSKGVTVQTAQVIVIYDRTPSGIVPIFGENVSTLMEPYEYGLLPVSLLEWEYLTL